MSKFQVSANDISQGVFDGETANEAILACYRDAGYIGSAVWLDDDDEIQVADGYRDTLRPGEMKAVRYREGASVEVDDQNGAYLQWSEGRSGTLWQIFLEALLEIQEGYSDHVNVDWDNASIVIFDDRKNEILRMGIGIKLSDDFLEQRRAFLAGERELAF